MNIQNVNNFRKESEDGEKKIEQIEKLKKSVTSSKEEEVITKTKSQKKKEF